MDRNNKIISGTIIVLLTAAIVWIVVAQRNNSDLYRTLNEQKLKTESLLSEKLELEKQGDKDRDKLNTLSSENEKLNEALEMKTENLTTQTRQNSRIKKALRTAEERYKEAQADLNQKLDSLQVSREDLNTQYKNLKDSVQMLIAQNNELEDDLEEAILTSMDETLVTAVKRNERKVTSKARRTRKLIATVNLPGKYDNMSFAVEGPNGSEISDKYGSLTSKVVADPETLTASTSGGGLSTRTQKVRIVYAPEEKLDPGIYKIKIFNDDLYVGSMEVKLR